MRTVLARRLCVMSPRLFSNIFKVEQGMRKRPCGDLTSVHTRRPISAMVPVKVSP